MLLQSLTAEHAARFIAMDSSTTNAASLLDTMKLQYNKLRQAKITRELTDLMSAL
jgi:F-type H+-transporting ATPase subunit gamma